jgi:hypothetical protein
MAQSFDRKERYSLDIVYKTHHQSSGYSSRMLLTNSRSFSSHLLKYFPAIATNLGGRSTIEGVTISMFSSATYRTLRSSTLQTLDFQFNTRLLPRILTESDKNFGTFPLVIDRYPFVSPIPHLRHIQRPSQL